MSLCVLTNVKEKCAQQCPCAGPCQLWIACNREKNKCLSIDNDILPNYNENIVWSCRLKVHTLNAYLNARACHTICSINPNRITHANQFSDPCVRQDARRPNQSQRFDVAEPVPHWARCGASLRSATVFRNRIPSGWKSPKLRGERNRIPKNSLIPLQKNWPECPSFWHRLGTLKYQDSTWSERQSHSYDLQTHVTNTKGKCSIKPTCKFPQKLDIDLQKTWKHDSTLAVENCLQKNVAKFATTKQTLTTTFQTNNSVVSRVWAPALAFATLFRKQ